jgi:Rrf2 family iron-sulfur cluster assembly transcriptional regulator
MLLTTKSRYAIMAMVDLAHISLSAKPVALHEIAERQQIAIKYLEQIFVCLRKNLLVISSKGPGGGYMLAKRPEEIKLIEIVFAVEEDIKMTRCSKPNSGCMTKGIKCSTHDVWRGLENVVEEYFGNISVQDIVSKANHDVRCL